MKKKKIMKKKKNVINDVNKKINEDKIEENILEEVKINNVNNNNGKKNENEEFKLDLNITEEGKPANKVRRHEKYTFCGYKNEDNKCCIII